VQTPNAVAYTREKSIEDKGRDKKSKAAIDEVSANQKKAGVCTGT
jgi:hypothetical protein